MMEKWTLPTGWEWSRLGDLVTVNYGKGLSVSQRQGGHVPVLGANGVVGHHNMALTQAPAIVVGRKGSAGAVNFSEIACWPIDTTFFIDEFPASLFPRYLFHFLRSQPLVQLQQSAAIPGLNRDILYGVEVPIPFPDDPPRSLAEQRRIVARLEALLGEVREMRQLQAEIEADVGRLTEAVLADVFSKYSAAEMKPIGEIADVKGGKRLPKGEDFALDVTEHPYLRVIDFHDFSIDRSNLRYLKPETYQKIRRYTISSDDIYISIAGTIGLVGTVPDELDGANLTENAAKLVFKPEYKDRVDKEFIMFYLASLQGRRQIEERSKAAGQPKLALMRIETIEVPILQSLVEQQETVAHVRNIALELKELHSSEQQDRLALDALEQSVLAQAFRGEL